MIISFIRRGSSVVERRLGKTEVKSPILFPGSFASYTQVGLTNSAYLL